MSTTKPASTDWLPKAAAAKFLGIGLRALERREAIGQIEKRALPRELHQSTARVEYSRKDLEAIRAGKPNQHARLVREDDLQPLAASPVPVNGKSTALARTGHLSDEIRSMRGFTDALMSSREAFGPAVATKPWLTLAEASAYSGLPEAWLLVRAKQGVDWAVDVSTGATNRIWRFRRESLAGELGS